MYYPLSEITPNQYTNGDEFVYEKNKSYYKGYYYYTTDGKYFTGKTFSPTSLELLKISSHTTPTFLKKIDYTPTVTNEDYNKGYIIRYVLKRVNSGNDTIKEISKETYERHLKNPLYVVKSFNWIITGPLFDSVSESNYTIYGVITKNKRTIDQLETEVPGISTYFKNFSEYAL